MPSGQSQGHYDYSYGNYVRGMGGGSPPTKWNPQGTWTDPMGAGVHTKFFSPHIFMADLVNSPQARAYQDVEGTARSIGVEGARRGEAQEIERTRQTAANQGLGKGFAESQESQIRQQGTQQATDALMAAEMEGKARRFQMATIMAASLVETHKYMTAYYLQRKAMKSGEDAAQMGMLGNIIGSVIGAGATIGAAGITAA